MVETGHPKRKLAAILSADVAGYGRLMQDDEAATVATLQEYRSAIGRVVERHGGRIVNAPGDNLLAEFPSAVEAVQAGCEIQQVLRGRNLELRPERRMEFRVGVNLGDVIEEADGTIYGDGVNIAARMEALADTGGICISNTVYEAVESKLDFGFDFLGEQQVKNVAKPVRVYRVRAEAAPASSAKPMPRGAKLAALAAASVVVVIGGVAVWQLARAPAPEQVAEADPVLALPDGPAIAVLPFENVSGDPEQDYFSTGLTEDIITRLSRFPQLFVIARNSTNQYKGKAVDVRAVGRDLGARYVVEGSVRKAADTVRVTVQVLDAEDGTHLWAETYDRDLTAADLFAVQDEITEQVAATIGDSAGILVRAKLKAIKAKPTDSLDAYECVARITEYYDATSPVRHFEVRDCLERTVELDSNYADAWVNLGFVYLDEDRFGFNPRPGSLDRALAAARRAVGLDANNEVARSVLALVHFHRHELDSFFAEAERAIALNPNNATMLASLGLNMGFAGDLDRGAALVRKAAALNPNHPDWYYFSLFNYHYRKGEYQKALDMALKINMPEFFWSHGFLAVAYGQLGRKAEARTAIGKLLEWYPTFPDNAWDEFRKWNMPEEAVEHYADGLRKAGLDIPDEPEATH